MKMKKNFEGKKPAQAMVEFAIALPVLLLLLYGILEAGRLLFLYSTVVTASRQAVRYGSATGEALGAIRAIRTAKAYAMQQGQSDIWVPLMGSISLMTPVLARPKILYARIRI